MGQRRYIKGCVNNEEVAEFSLLDIIFLPILILPLLLMDLFDIANETTEYERRCYK